MRCPNCKLLTSDRKDSCPKCGIDLRARKQELGITANEESAPARFSKPPVATPVKTEEHFSAVSAIASATLQIDNAIQEVSKKSAHNQASQGGLPIVMEEAIDFDPDFDSDISSDNLLFEQPVEALQISDDELDVLLSTTAQSQLTAVKPALSKKDLLSSLLTQAAQRPAVKTQPKPVQSLSAAPTQITQPTEELLQVVPPPPPAPVASASEDEFEFELNLEPEPETFEEPPTAHVSEIEAWEVETSPEVIEKFKCITARFNPNDYEALLQAIEELTGFNLPDMYPEILERSSENYEEPPSYEDPPPQAEKEPPPPVEAQIETAENSADQNTDAIAEQHAGPAEENQSEVDSPICETVDEAVAEEIQEEPPKALCSEPTPDPVADKPDLPTLWAEAVTADLLQTVDSNEVSALDLLAEPDPRFIRPLFERLVEKNEFDPDAPKPAISARVTRKHVENTELQSALKKFVEEEEISESVASPSPETWNEEIPTEFGDSNDNRTSLLFSIAFGIFTGIAVLFFGQSEDSFSSANLLIAIFSTGTSSLLTYAGLSVLCRILFWTALSYPVIKIIRERVFVGR